MTVAILTTVVLAQALDPLAGERDAIERLALLLPLRPAHRAGGEDEIALDDVALDVAAGTLAEDGDFVPAGALDPFAAVVATAEARSDADAQRGADLLDSPSQGSNHRLSAGELSASSSFLMGSGWAIDTAVARLFRTCLFP